MSSTTPDRVVLKWIAACAVVVAGALATHFPYAVAADCLDSDAAVVTLMGRHFAHGDKIAPFLWGSRYMGVLDVWALVPFDLAGARGLTGACLAALSLTLIQTICIVRIARRLHGHIFVAALLAVTTSAVTAFSQTTLYGGRLAATTCSLLALDLVYGRRTPARAALAGCLIGAAVYADHLMVIWLLPLGVSTYRARSLKFLAATAAPWLVFERICYAVTTGPKPGVADPWEWPRNIKLLLFDGAPMMFGMDWLAARQHNYPPPVASIAWILASMATLGFALGAFLYLARHGRTQEVAELFLVPLATAAIFVLAAWDIQSTRYLAPAWPAIVILVSIAAAKRPLFAIAGAVVMAVNTAFSVRGDPLHAHGAAAGRACRAELSETSKALTDAGVQGVWADYWDAYRLGLFMDEQLPFTPFAPGVDRYHEWSDEVRKASPVGYLLDESSAPPGVRDALAGAALPTRVGRYLLYVVPESLHEGARP
jgi:hypothetical protein